MVPMKYYEIWNTSYYTSACLVITFNACTYINVIYVSEFITFQNWKILRGWKINWRSFWFTRKVHLWKVLSQLFDLCQLRVDVGIDFVLPVGMLWCLRVLFLHLRCCVSHIVHLTALHHRCVMAYKSICHRVLEQGSYKTSFVITEITGP